MPSAVRGVGASSLTRPRTDVPELAGSQVNFIHVFLYQFLRFREALGPEAVVRVRFHAWIDPELGLALCMLHMHVRPWLFARKK